MPGPDDHVEWLLTPAERGNGQTLLDAAHQGRAWSEGNRLQPLTHGATYFADPPELGRLTRAFASLPYVPSARSRRTTSWPASHERLPDHTELRTR